MNNMTVKVNTSSLPPILLMVSGMLLFLSGWDFDFAVNRTVYLPLLSWEVHIPGWEFAIISLITAFFAYVIDAFALVLIERGIKQFLPLYVAIVVGYGAIVYSYIHILPLSLVEYGQVWNSIFYFYVVPIFLLINAIKLKLVTVKNGVSSSQANRNHK